MVYVSDLFDQLRLLLNDPADSQVPFTTKKLYLNRGIAKMWPHVWRVATESGAISATVTNYALTYSGGPSDGEIIGVEIEDAYGNYQRYDSYDILAGDEDSAATLVFAGVLPADATAFRVRYVSYVPLIAATTYVLAQAEAWNGPDRAVELPVLYAMGMVAASKLDDRQDTYRYSTTQAQNGVSDSSLMGSAQMWFAQFEDSLLQFERPLPIARD